MEKLFVYGTLRYGKYQKECWGRTMRGKRAVLPGYLRDQIFMDHARYKYWVIFPRKGAATKGLVIELTSQELEVADVYEEKYNRRQVTLESGEMVWAYVVKPHYLT